MDINFTNDQEFRDLIRTKQEDILKKTTNNIRESEGFKILFISLKKMIEDNAFRGFKVIRINKESLLDIKLDKIKDVNDLFSTDDFKFHQILDIDGSLEIISKERKNLPSDNNEARRVYSEMSKEHGLIFLLIHDKINYFIDGIEVTESIFFSLEEFQTYKEKKDISQIKLILNEYQERLKDRHCYCKFFVSKSHLQSLHSDLGRPEDIKTFTANFCHLLQNKPEDKFREDLRIFLKENLKVSLVKEYLLESFKRLDIFLFDDFGEIYLIEVKWVGASVHQEGKKVGTEYDHGNIVPEAFRQTLNYLEELDNKGQNIVKAFLVVFDARKEDLLDTGTNFDKSILNPTQTKHHRKFEKVKDLRVKNTHPS